MNAPQQLPNNANASDQRATKTPPQASDDAWRTNLENQYAEELGLPSEEDRYAPCSQDGDLHLSDSGSDSDSSSSSGSDSDSSSSSGSDSDSSSSSGSDEELDVHDADEQVLDEDHNLPLRQNDEVPARPQNDGEVLTETPIGKPSFWKNWKRWQWWAAVAAMVVPGLVVIFYAGKQCCRSGSGPKLNPSGQEALMNDLQRANMLLQLEQQKGGIEKFAAEAREYYPVAAAFGGLCWEVGNLVGRLRPCDAKTALRYTAKNGPAMLRSAAHNGYLAAAPAVRAAASAGAGKLNSGVRAAASELGTRAGKLGQAASSAVASAPGRALRKITG